MNTQTSNKEEGGKAAVKQEGTSGNETVNND